MRKRLTREQLLTIPNAMSLFRLLLIPFIVWSFWSGEIYIAVGLVALSAVTDMLDGVVARRFNMVSDVGKILDPIADKLTQAALLVCLIADHKMILFLLALLVIKETLMAFFGGMTLKKCDSVQSAKWHGKLCTVVFESTMIVLMLFPSIPENVVNMLILICGIVMLFSLVMYLIYYISMICGKARS